MMIKITNFIKPIRFCCSFTVLTGAILLFFSLPVYASQDRFGGVFHEGKDPHNLEVGLTWNQLIDRMVQFGERDQKLIDVEIIQRQSLLPERCEPPTFAGVWRQGNYEQSIIGGLIWKHFKKQVKLQRKWYGMNIIDIETHVECGIRKYVGIFSKGAKHQKIKKRMTWDVFIEEYASMHEAGWHLIDIETYEDNNVRYWAAIWNKGYRDEWLWAVPRQQFEDLQEFVNGGLQLIDMESWREGGDLDGNRMIAGLFYRSPDLAFMETGENWPKFLSLWAELTDDNRLVDLEIYPDTTDHRWENIFSQVLTGKAMGWSFAVMESGILAEAGAEGWARSPNEIFNPYMAMTAGSVMNVASVTKMLTVVGMLKLHEQNPGNWLIDVPVQRQLYFPVSDNYNSRPNSLL